MNISKSKYHISLYQELIKRVPELFRFDYKRRFYQNPEEQSQILAEVRSFILFNEYLSCTVTDMHYKTKSNKNVDLVVKNSRNEIHVEVYSNDEKWDTNENAQFAKIDRALIHGLDKFTDTQPNIVVLADEDINSILQEDDIDERLRSVWMGNGDDLHTENLCKVNALIILKQSGNFDTDGFIVSPNPKQKYPLPDDSLKRIRSFSFMEEISQAA